MRHIVAQVQQIGVGVGQIGLLTLRLVAKRAFDLLGGGHHDRPVRENARSARDDAGRNLAEELSRRRKADGPTARAGSACDSAGNVLAHEPRMPREPSGRVCDL